MVVAGTTVVIAFAIGIDRRCHVFDTDRDTESDID
jgi:hypothetical protein